jgi:hypothetical protein
VTHDAADVHPARTCCVYGGKVHDDLFMLMQKEGQP